jgi:alkylation response protein AidB-like acyl-CoA dehydrogenase
VEEIGSAQADVVEEIGSAQAHVVEGPGTAARAAGATGFMQRAVLRRRVRFLRRRRELALHDLGGFVFESHRLGDARNELLAQKLAAIGALDDELATLQSALDLREELAVLHEPGVASCPQCSTIHDSAANYCPTCGRPTTGEQP